MLYLIKETYDKIKTFYWNNLKLSDMIIALIIVLIVKSFLDTYYLPEVLNDMILGNKDNIYIVIATIAGTLLGFIITSISIIIAFLDSKKLDLIRDTDHVNDLFNIFFSAIKFLAVTTLIAIFGLISSYWTTIVFYILLFVVIISILLIWACIWALEIIIEALTT